MNDARRTAPRGAAAWLVPAGRFVSLVYLHFMVWLALWVLIPLLLLGWQPIAVTSGSMGPAIAAGDVVLVARHQGQELRNGQVVTFDDPAEPGRVLTHRIVARNDDGTYQTKGDANPDSDSVPVAAESVRGVGRLVVPRVGLPVVWLEQGRVAVFGAWLLSVLCALGVLPGRRPRQLRPAPTPAAPGVAAAAATPAPARPLAAISRPTPAVPAPPRARAVSFAVVPPAAYHLRLPAAPPPLALPQPPQWSVSLVPPAPGSQVAPIPPPPPAAGRRPAPRAGRSTPSFGTRLHALLIVLAIVAGAVLTGSGASPAQAAFRSSSATNSGNSMSAASMEPVTGVNTEPSDFSCFIWVRWTASPTTWATHYEVWRKTTSQTEYSYRGSVAYGTNTYQDNNTIPAGTTFQYRVRAIKSGTTWVSAWAGPVNGTSSVLACSI